MKLYKATVYLSPRSNQWELNACKWQSGRCSLQSTYRRSRFEAVIVSDVPGRERYETHSHTPAARVFCTNKKASVPHCLQPQKSVLFTNLGYLRNATCSHTTPKFTLSSHRLSLSSNRCRNRHNEQFFCYLAHNMVFTGYSLSLNGTG